MDEKTTLTAVLDACVLYPASMRDILLRLARMGLYAPKWSEEINAEWMRNLLKNRDDLKEEALKRTLSRMNTAFDKANVSEFDHHIPIIELPDPDDRHVVACAIEGEAAIIVTKNLKDFPTEELETYNIIAQHPDDFICDLFELDKEAAIGAFKKQLKSLKNPPQTKEELLATFRKNDLVKAAELFAQNIE